MEKGNSFQSEGLTCCPAGCIKFAIHHPSASVSYPNAGQHAADLWPEHVSSGKLISEFKIGNNNNNINNINIIVVVDDDDDDDKQQQ